VSTITAKELHLKTKAVLNQLEEGETLLITRHGRPIGRIEPLTAGGTDGLG
jgi:antitoxin (DNA-binding transcriptional repressor) of toxin-antitoxin stability system